MKGSHAWYNCQSLHYVTMVYKSSGQNQSGNVTLCYLTTWHQNWWKQSWYLLKVFLNVYVLLKCLYRKNVASWKLSYTKTSGNQFSSWLKAVEKSYLSHTPSLIHIKSFDFLLIESAAMYKVGSVNNSCLSVAPLKDRWIVPLFPNYISLFRT